MRKSIFSSVFALALRATTGWGVNKSMSNDAGLSDLALANVEALAAGESGRVDCVRSYDFCEEFVKYSDGSWGIDILYDHKKRAGWL